MLSKKAIGADNQQERLKKFKLNFEFFVNPQRLYAEPQHSMY